MINPVVVGQKITLLRFKSFSPEMKEYYGDDVEVEVTHVSNDGHTFWYKAPNGFESFQGAYNENAMFSWMYDDLNHNYTKQIQSYK